MIAIWYPSAPVALDNFFCHLNEPTVEILLVPALLVSSYKEKRLALLIKVIEDAKDLCVRSRPELL